MHDIRYIPLALEDLVQIISFITDVLKSPQTAMDLIDDFDTSIARLAHYPYSCRLYQTEFLLEAEYRVLPVKNYLVFYVATENEVQIHRIIFAKMDIINILKK